MLNLNDLDSWIQDGGPAALRAVEHLEPIEGPQGVLFPPTYAAAEDKSKFGGGYNIDVFPKDERAIGSATAAMIKDGRLRPTADLFSDGPNVCLVDSVGSQANRVEMIFATPKYRALVPQIVIKVGDKTINLLAAGHRAGDALIRFSKAGETTWDAFQALLTQGNAEPMAKIAPTSLVFGVWDSRGTQVKVARAFRSVIRAYNVLQLTRSAQFNRATKFVEEDAIDDSLDKGKGDENPLSREGFKDNPASASHGGIIARDGVRRETTVNLAAIRRLRSGSNADAIDAEEHLRLRRYILGLSLVAATAESDALFDLREGCHLRQKPGTEVEWVLVPYRGKDTTYPMSSTDAASYAIAAADAFGVGPSDIYDFNKAVADKWLALKKEEQDTRRRKGPMTKQFDGETTAVEGAVARPAGRKPNKQPRPEGA